MAKLAKEQSPSLILFPEDLMLVIEMIINTRVRAKQTKEIIMNTNLNILGQSQHGFKQQQQQQQEEQQAKQQQTSDTTVAIAATTITVIDKFNYVPPALNILDTLETSISLTKSFIS